MTRMMMRIAALLAMGTAALVAPMSAGAASSKTTTSSPSYYISLGDSYAMGYQPGTYNPAGSETLNGFSNKVVNDLSPAHTLTLENFGCGGATTTSMLKDVGCPDQANQAPIYPTGDTQQQAALAFIKAHPGQIGLITISIGGNDFDSCIKSASPVPCVAAALPKMEANIKLLSKQLRAAAGSTVPMISITYPDVVLGAWLAHPSQKAFAKLSVVAFKDLINPDLKAGYKPSKTHLVDVTKATGAYIPLTKTVKDPTYARSRRPWLMRAPTPGSARSATSTRTTSATP